MLLLEPSTRSVWAALIVGAATLAVLFLRWVPGCCLREARVVVSAHRRRAAIAGSAPPARLLSASSTRTRWRTDCLTPLVLSPNLTLRNRFVRAAAFGGSKLTDLIRVHTEVAAGGVAMTTVAYASVEPEGCTFSEQMVIADRADDLSALATAVHASGAKLSVQLVHAGGFADPAACGLSCRAIAPSSVWNPAVPTSWPKQMDAADMVRVRAAFVSSARVVADAGVDAVEVHLGHGYLLSQFLSPLTNTRTDLYGGVIANRARFPLQVVSDVVNALKAAGAGVAVLVKLNVDDGFDGGITLDEAVQVAQWLERAGVHAIVPSGGFVSRNGLYMLRGGVPHARMAQHMPTLSKAVFTRLFSRLFVPSTPWQPTFWLAAASRLRDAVTIPVALLGGVDTWDAAEGAVEAGFGFVQMARALIREPDLVRRFETDAGRRSSPDSLCSHCNHCVLGALDPKLGTRCVEREPADEW